MMRNLLLFILALLPLTAFANIYSIPENGGRLVGELQHHVVQKGDYFQTISKQYNIGILELMASNPGVDPFLPTPGTRLLIPTQMLLPDVPHKGVVINLAELRLYFFPKGGKEVHVFPVGIGRVGRETPEMVTRIKSRIPNPSWTPPASIRKEHLEERGEVLPRVVPAGPDNPLGKFAIQLSYGDGSYLIHGTNKDFGIGMRVSAGCIRLNPDDIEWLFDQVRYGDQVTIINETIKTSTEPDGRQLIEVHSPLSTANGGDNTVKELKRGVVEFIRQDDVDYTKANDALLTQAGIPVNIEE
ncbi:L,D-transpeptidase family protein [Shewanella fidelis]|uniref:L,D-transpeptidase family protein n=1 Tax=Shewanella fidelis TaxID=173509 RepID=A0AAW8NNS9_9GAMM|nr:L,D-transpeptidase family protein [Shewanella fidelis]MDR8524843.1 L,D-transpeptidase family protein [Shewanella fidelis]MDW4810914.1 L,D-transpeptidase family protein [Shewanella fidelis]MDW4815307.1 L,D-transpeptidase family protein [Shewanella fidelis]MDW4819397.1 L,D-transpeptidase family protein [Shewanella fidelis]MDW4822925.1 L,D-transpeptidase family protein [Shewanella fidelis]